MKMRFMIGVLFVFSRSALAYEVDFSQHIVDLDRKDIPASTAKDAPPMILKDVALQGLFNPPSPDPIGVQKRFDLEVRINKGGKIDLKSEEIGLIKDAIKSFYEKIPFGSLVYGRSVEILEQKVTP